jgi:hypothetical protein
MDDTGRPIKTTHQSSIYYPSSIKFDKEILSLLVDFVIDHKHFLSKKVVFEFLFKSLIRKV